MSLASCRNRVAEQIDFDSQARFAVRGSLGRHDFYGTRSPIPMKAAPIVMIVLAATMIGASSGVLIADRNALLLIRENVVSQVASVRGYLRGRVDTPRPKPATPTVIPTGLSSIIALSYSSEADSAHLSFDLEDAALVRTGKLRSPDRIYFDLQDHNGEQGTLRRLKSQKAINLAGNLLTGVRISQSKQGAMRIVLDLKSPCDFTYQTSPGPPSRLMIEIRPRPTIPAASE